MLDYNYINIDWGPLANPLFSTYPITVKYYIPTVAGRIRDLIQLLVSSGIVTLRDTHLIGHSLGAHVAGLVGNLTQQQDSVDDGDGRKIGRITGLDPAGLGFDPPALGRKIMKSDAEFVDVYHTTYGFTGDKTADGHVDFYRKLNIKFI
jgi:pimeloyl-ACP methyl ester carboxylesterase